MGGRGAESGKSRLSAAKVDLDYAQAKYSEYAKALNYTNRQDARERMEFWKKERDAARERYDKIYKRLKKKRLTNRPF